MTTTIDPETYALCGALQRQHDLFLAITYQRGIARHANLDAIARDPETMYNIEATEALTTLLEEHDNG